MVKNSKLQTPSSREAPNPKLQYRQPQRDCVLQPGVASNELSWEGSWRAHNAERVSPTLVGRRKRPSRQMTFPQRRRELGALSTELLVAMALLVAALFPLAYSFASERRLARSYYQRAVAMEIVDGEMEVLLAGEWRSYKPGVQEYHIKGSAVTNLPPGRFQLEVAKEKVRLEWLPTAQMQGGPVAREGRIQ
jgi:hypothetical protein